MAKSQEMEAVDAAQVVGYSDSGFEWTTVHTEAADQLVFETEGDTYIGIYAGHELIWPEPEKDPAKWFVQLRWTDPAGAKFTNAGYELRNAYTQTTIGDAGSPVVTDRIPVGSMTRTELMKFVEVDQASPMKSFRVDVAEARSAGNSA